MATLKASRDLQPFQRGPDLEPSQKGPIPLFVGVTGHRNIPVDAVRELKSAARRVLTSLMRAHPHTRIIVLSPLSEGADRIVAQAALGLGLELVCPLPMSEAEFQKDFKQKDSVDEFYRLLGQSARHFIVPCPTLRDDHEHRYEALAVRVVQMSDILIALWDGNPPKRIAGTAKTVEFKTDGVPKSFDPDRNALDLPDTGPVHHIVTPREGESVPNDVFAHHVRWPKGSNKKKYGEILKKIDEFNAFAAQRGSRPLQAIDDFCFKLTDERAKVLRFRIDRIRLAVFLCAFFSFVSFELSRDPTRYKIMHWPGFVLYVLFFLAAALMVLLTRRLGTERNQLDYRALAEACRIQSFWHRLHLRDDVADHYLHKQRGQVQWIRKALRSLCTLVEVHRTITGPASVSPETIRELKKDWVETELQFFAQRARTDERRHNMFNGSATVLVVASVAVGIFTFLRSPEWLLVSPILAVLAALVHGYAEQCALAQHAREYGRMQTVYANANATLNECLSADKFEPNDIIKLFRDLGNEALAENGDWLLVHRDRPIEIAHG